MSREARVIKESLNWLEPVADTATGYFYGRLFAAEPGLRALFPPAMNQQRDRLLHALTKIVWSLDHPEENAELFARLGREHRRFGVLPEHYPAMGAALIATLRHFSGGHWTDEAEAAWTSVYQSISELMIAAAERDAAHAPAWWVAEVTEHDRRAPDLAVLALRPDRPLPFEPGQHLPVQVRRWARIWRRYWLAGAPRPDGTLRLHVRAVPGGWVSGTLVRGTGVGDTVLLGPASGGLTLDPACTHDLLLVADDTGLAPLKAITERVALHARDRAVHLLLGARTEAGHYDLDDLRTLGTAHPRLRITTVTGHDALTGAIEEHADPARHQVFLAGPARMVEGATDLLERLGVPAAHVRHDLLELQNAAPHQPPRSFRKAVVTESAG